MLICKSGPSKAEEQAVLARGGRGIPASFHAYKCAISGRTNEDAQEVTHPLQRCRKGQIMFLITS